MRNGKAGAAGMAVLLAIGVGGASATANGAKDRVSGGGSNGHPVADNHFSISALSDPDGTDARGRFEFHDAESGPPTERISGEVKCLRVVDNRATAVARIERDNVANREGRYVILRMEDNGPPRRGVSPDEIRIETLAAGARQPPCPPPADIAPRGLSNGQHRHRRRLGR